MTLTPSWWLLSDAARSARGIESARGVGQAGAELTPGDVGRSEDRLGLREREIGNRQVLPEVNDFRRTRPRRQGTSLQGLGEPVMPSEIGCLAGTAPPDHRVGPPSAPAAVPAVAAMWSRRLFGRMS